MQVWCQEYAAAVSHYLDNIRLSVPNCCWCWPQDPELLSFIDIECYCWSTVLADLTPMINSGMVFCDRHYGGINYPKASAIPPPPASTFTRTMQHFLAGNCVVMA